MYHQDQFKEDMEVRGNQELFSDDELELFIIECLEILPENELFFLHD